MVNAGLGNGQIQLFNNLFLDFTLFVAILSELDDGIPDVSQCSIASLCKVYPHATNIVTVLSLYSVTFQQAGSRAPLGNSRAPLKS